MLVIENLSTYYGAIQALDRVSIEVKQGQFVAIVGPNGAGKTTLFDSICGHVKPQSGRITFNGIDLLKLPAKDRAHLGLAHVPEGRQVFPNLTVYENLLMGATTQQGRADWQKNLEMCFTLFPVLAERRDQLAGTLSGGEQQMVAIARGLASSPKLLLLDEPSMGLAPIVVDMIFERIKSLHEEMKLSILLVEQRVVEALDPCDWAYVLNVGRCVASGLPQDIIKDKGIAQAYLGMQ
jgi:branched-chain amino acid transport system ATP-binding protein